MANSNIGTLVMGGGVNAAFDGAVNEPFDQSAYLDPSVSGYANWVGKNWSANVTNVSVPPGLSAPLLGVAATQFVAYAPNDRAFLSMSAPTGLEDFDQSDFDQSEFAGPLSLSLSGDANFAAVDFNRDFQITNTAFRLVPLPVGYQFQGSANGLAWTTLASGTTAGTVAESINVTTGAGASYAYHRLVFNGNGLGPVSVAELVIYGQLQAVDPGQTPGSNTPITNRAFSGGFNQVFS